MLRVLGSVFTINDWSIGFAILKFKIVTKQDDDYIKNGMVQVRSQDQIDAFKLKRHTIESMFAKI